MTGAETTTLSLTGHESCDACALSLTRNHVVPGRGSLSARIVVVGEAPGETEDGCGEPFVGPSGQLLRNVLEHAGVPAARLWFTNVYHCRPPKNDVTLAEGSPCPSMWLSGELVRLNRTGARVILATGGTAIKYFRPWSKDSVTAEVQRDTRWPDPEIGPWWIVGMYHPSYILRCGGEQEGNYALVRMVDSILRGVAYASHS